MAKSRINDQSGLIIALVGYLVAVGLTYMILLRPLFTELKKLQAESSATEEYVVLKNTASQLTLFKDHLAARSRPNIVAASLDSLAAPTGVTLTSVRPDTSALPMDPGFLLRRYQVVVEGRYAQIHQFLTTLEQTKDYYIVTNFAMMRTDNKTGRSHAELLLRTLTVPEQRMEPQGGAKPKPKANDKPNDKAGDKTKATSFLPPTRMRMPAGRQV